MSERIAKSSMVQYDHNIDIRGTVQGGPGSVLPAQGLRANRFTPTPWHEMQGS